MFEAIISGYRWFFLLLASFLGAGWAIVALSCICSALMMPLMRAVAGIVRRETEYQSVILPQVASIKEKYESDMDRHLHIERLYVRYGYSPLSPVKKILPLFVQIPFLLLTYFMLKGTAELPGVSFLFLKDLGAADALVGGFNLLPFVMTGVNLITVFGTPGFTSRDQVQAIAIALLFLIMLYTAPAALLLYWTLNNVITMVRVLWGNGFAGGRLLVGRIAWLVHAARTDATLQAYTTVVLFLLSCYLFVTSRAMVVLVDQRCVITYMTCYNWMLPMLAVAFVPMALLLWKDRTAWRPVLMADLSVLTLLCGLLLSLRFIFSDLYYAFKTNADRFVCFEVMLCVFLVPLAIRRAEAFRNFGRDVLSALRQDWPLLLFPAALGVHYSFSSENLVLSAASVALLSLYLAVPCVLVGVLLVGLFRMWIAPDSLIRMAVGLLVGLYVLPMVSADSGALCYDQNIVARIVVVGLSSTLFLLLGKRRFFHSVSVLVFVLALSNSIFHRMKLDAGTVKGGGEVGGDLSKIIETSHCIRSNNVYVLIYDSYAQPEMLKGLGLYDSTVFQALKDHAFTIYDAYSEGDGTLASMSRFYAFGGVAGATSRSTVAGDNVYGDFFRREGYRTSYLMCGYTMPSSGDRLPGDYYYPTPSCMVPQELVLFACILRGVMSQNASVFNYYTHREWVERKREVLAGCRSRPNFVYAHSAVPDHNNRTARTREGDLAGIADYSHRLKEANLELKEDLEALANDRDSIVIIASDHGPNLLMAPINGEIDVRHLLDKCGTLLAIRWPQGYKPVLQLKCLQNVLVEVLIYLTGDESLKRYAVRGKTVPIKAEPLDFPEGAVLDGIIQVGADRGKDIFAAAREKFNGGKR